ncbi:MAG: flippase [Phototrophicaceae bacterium]
MHIIRQRLSQNTLALLLSNGGSAVLSFMLSVMIGRVLGQDGLGIYATVLAWIFPLSLITEFGLGTLITRDIALKPEDSHAYLRASILARLVIGGVITLIIYSTAPLISQDIHIVRGLQIASPLIIILPFYSSFTAIFRAKQIMQPITWLNLGMLISQVSLTGLAFWYGEDIESVLIINTLTSFVQLFAAWLVYRRWFYEPSQQIIPLQTLLVAATPFAIAAVLAAIQSRIAIILLEQFTSTSDVGLYTAAARFIEAGRMLPHAFFDALFPVLASLATIPHELKRMFQRVLVGLTTFGIAFAVVISWISLPLLTLTYGQDFISARSMLIILAWSLLPMLLKGGRTLYWYAVGETMYVNLVTVGVIIIQVIAAIWLIPSYGAMGAAWVMVIAETSAVILLFARRH